MILSKKHRILLLKSRKIKLLETVIPHSKVLNYNNLEYLAVPHRIDEVRVLRNMGYNVPSPILHYYDWPRHSTIEHPFYAQLETAAFLTLFNRAHVHNGLGSGKTLGALWAYDYLRSIGAAKNLLVVSPLSTLELTWGDTLFEHFPHLDFMVLHGTRKQRFDRLKQEADVYVVNHDGVKILQDALKDRDDITHVIVDELAQVARNAKTDRWKSLNAVVNKQQNGTRSCWGLTATPIPNEPTDAWAQAKLVTPETVPPYFTRFRDQVMRQAGPYKWVARPNALDKVHEALQPAIRFSREECVDLPPTTYTDRFVALTAEQEKAYKNMHSTLKAEIEDGQVTAVNEAVKVLKLVQIACGIVYDRANNECWSLPCKPRLEETLSLVQDSHSKTIVFVPFVAAVEGVAEYLRSHGFNVGVIHGGIKKTDRDDIFHGFQRGSAIDCIVAQPAAMSHGLTLTAASTIVWYAPVNSAEVYEQANGRITRPGQKHNTLIVNIAGTAIETKMYKRLKSKQKMQNILLDKVVGSRAA